MVKHNQRRSKERDGSVAHSVLVEGAPGVGRQRLLSSCASNGPEERSCKSGEL